MLGGNILQAFAVNRHCKETDMEFKDVFISYSRVDGEFTEALKKALEDQGLDVWFDKEEIPIGTDFQSYINKSIIDAHVFLFIISPNSAISEFCSIEVNEALRYNKKIIPIVYRLGDTEEEKMQVKKMHDSLKAINWFFLEKGKQEISDRIESLVSDINKDQTFISLHTKILSRACKWEEQHRSRSLYFQGKERIEIENWLSYVIESTDVPVKPVKVQYDFITSNREYYEYGMIDAFFHRPSNHQDCLTQNQLFDWFVERGFICKELDIKSLKNKSSRAKMDEVLLKSKMIIVPVYSDASSLEEANIILDGIKHLNKPYIILKMDENVDAYSFLGSKLSYSIDFSNSHTVIPQLSKLNGIIEQNNEYFDYHRELTVRNFYWQELNRREGWLLFNYKLKKVVEWHNTHHKDSDQLFFDHYIQESVAQQLNVDFDTFLIFNQEDTDLSTGVDLRLKEFGVVNWYDHHYLPDNERQEELLMGLRKAEFVLIIIGKRPGFDEENELLIQEAIKRNKKIALLVFDKTTELDRFGKDKDKYKVFQFNQGEQSKSYSDLKLWLQFDKEYSRALNKLTMQSIEWEQNNKEEEWLLSKSKLQGALNLLKEAEENKQKQQPIEITTAFVLESKAHWERIEQEEQRKQQYIKELEEKAKNASTRIVDLFEENEIKDVNLTIPAISEIRSNVIEEINAFYEKNKTSNLPLAIALNSSEGMLKDNLLKSFQNTLVEEKVFFGSYDFQTTFETTPLDFITFPIQAFVDWIILNFSDELESLKSTIRNAIGTNGALLIELIPSAEIIIGKHQEDAGGVAHSDDVIYKSVIAPFLDCLVSEDRQFFLSLQNAEYCPDLSLDIFSDVASAISSPWITVVVLLDNDDAGIQQVEDFSKLFVATDFEFQEFVIENLSLLEIKGLLAETLRQDHYLVEVPAQVLFEKTFGDYSLIHGAIKELWHNKLLNYDTTTRSWNWEKGSFNALRLNESKAQIVLNTLGQLSDAHREIANLAACSGGELQIDFLEQIFRRFHNTEMPNLEPLIDHKIFVLSSDKKALSFSSKAYAKIIYDDMDENKRMAIHLELARGLKVLGAQSSYDKSLVIHHYNKCIPLIDHDDERTEVCLLNLKVGRRVMSNEGSKSAFQFFKTGYDLIDKSQWQELYKNYYSLLIGYGQALVNLGKLEDAIPVFDELLENCQNVADKARVYNFYAEAYQSSGNPKRAFEMASEGLKLFGVEFPESQQEIDAELGELMEFLSSESVIEQLQKIDGASKDQLIVGQLYNSCVIAVYFYLPNNLAWISCRNIKHVLDNGLAPESAVAMAWYSMILMATGNPQLSFEYAELASQTANKFPDKPHIIGKTSLIAISMSLAWKLDFETSAKMLYEQFNNCHDNGDSPFAGYILLCTYISLLMEGKDSAQILKHCTMWRDYCEKYVPVELGQAQIRIKHQRRLMGLEDTMGINELEIIKNYENDENLTDTCESYMELLRSSVLFNEYQEAYEYGKKAGEGVAVSAAGTLLLNLRYYHFQGIAIAQLCRQTSNPLLLEKYREELNECLEKLKGWYELNPSNFEEWYYLVLAEEAILNGEFTKASELYFKTLQKARSTGRKMMEARTNEYLADFYSIWDYRFATAHLKEACVLYLECGAKGKAIQLENRIENNAGAQHV